MSLVVSFQKTPDELYLVPVLLGDVIQPRAILLNDAALDCKTRTAMKIYACMLS